MVLLKERDLRRKLLAHGMYLQHCGDGYAIMEGEELLRYCPDLYAVAALFLTDAEVDAVADGSGYR